ncbi:hypothetical protein N9I95_00550 [Flavobacteriaceae bacterium]|nr:hypothetical protein [Flavobacteriaceae bacterium]
MKNLTLLLSISILFQSCFNYKSVDYNNITTDKKQMVEVEMLDRTNFKGQLVSKDETTMTLEDNGSTQTILVEEIYEVKVVKFSALKTLGKTAKGVAWVAAAGGAILLFILLGGAGA